MKAILLILIVLVAAVLLFLLARRRESPCPWWLTFLLENPYVNFLAGSSKLLDRAGVSPGMRILDIGCGPGRITIPASKRVLPEGEVVALDLQEGMLKKLKKRIEEQGIENVRTVLGGIGQGHLDSCVFDRAFLVTVLGEIQDKGPAMKEIFDALKPGGILSITELFPDPDYQTKSTIRMLAEAAGFRVDRQYGTWLAFTMNFVRPEEGGSTS